MASQWRPTWFPAQWECTGGPGQRVTAVGTMAGASRSAAAARSRSEEDEMAGGSTEWRGRSVISKVVSLLDAFTPDQPELSLGDLSRITGLPVSTTYRLASELVGWGGLERADSGTGYRIGMRLWELGALAPRGATLRELAQPFMQDLYAATGENVHLAVLDGQEALYVDTVSGRGGGAGPVPARRAVAAARHRGGQGAAGARPRAAVRAACAAGLRRHTPHTVVTRPSCARSWPRCAGPGSATRARR